MYINSVKHGQLVFKVKSTGDQRMGILFDTLKCQNATALDTKYENKWHVFILYNQLQWHSDFKV